MYFYIEVDVFLVSRVVLPGSDEGSETQDEDRGAEDGQAEIVEHVNHHQRIQLVGDIF